MRGHLGAALVLLLGFAGSARTADITQCTQKIPAGDIGILQADLVCGDAGFCQEGLDVGDQPCTSSGPCAPGSACVRFGVRIGNGGRLELNGHSIGGPAAGSAVDCAGRCTITGPGSLAGAELGIHMNRGGHIVVKNLALQGNVVGIEGDDPGKLRLSDLTVSQNRVGLLVADVVAKTVDVSGNTQVGIQSANLRAIGVTANGNGEEGITSFGLRASLHDVSANGNGGAGFVAFGRATIVDSTLLGNNGGGAGFDVLTIRPPRLRNSSCGHSAALVIPPEGGFDAGASWGVCAND